MQSPLMPLAKIYKVIEPDGHRKTPSVRQKASPLSPNSPARDDNSNQHEALNCGIYQTQPQRRQSTQEEAILIRSQHNHTLNTQKLRPLPLVEKPEVLNAVKKHMPHSQLSFYQQHIFHKTPKQESGKATIHTTGGTHYSTPLHENSWQALQVYGTSANGVKTSTQAQRARWASNYKENNQQQVFANVKDPHKNRNVQVTHNNTHNNSRDKSRGNGNNQNMYMTLHDSKNPTFYLQPDVILKRQLQTPTIQQNKLQRKTSSSKTSFRRTQGNGFAKSNSKSAMKEMQTTREIRIIARQEDKPDSRSQKLNKHEYQPEQTSNSKSQSLKPDNKQSNIVKHPYGFAPNQPQELLAQDSNTYSSNKEQLDPNRDINTPETQVPLQEIVEVEPLSIEKRQSAPLRERKENVENVLKIQTVSNGNLFFTKAQVNIQDQNSQKKFINQSSKKFITDSGSRRRRDGSNDMTPQFHKKSKRGLSIEKIALNSSNESQRKIQSSLQIQITDVSKFSIGNIPARGIVIINESEQDKKSTQKIDPFQDYLQQQSTKQIAIDTQPPTLQGFVPRFASIQNMDPMLKTDETAKSPFQIAPLTDRAGSIPRTPITMSNNNIRINQRGGIPKTPTLSQPRNQRPTRTPVRKIKTSTLNVRTSQSSNGRPSNRFNRSDLSNRSESQRRYELIGLLCQNKTTLKDYDIQVLIGQGSFGVVQRATNKHTRKQVAIKQYEKSKLTQDQSRVDALQQEINILSQLDHIGIMKYYDSIDSGNKVSIVVEYINGNNLYQYIRKLPGCRIIDENEVKKIFTKIVEAVEYMHEQKVCHRDLKLENILIDRQSYQIKLIDFGFSVKTRSVHEQKLHCECGTPIYMSPEMAQKKDHLGGPADIWALGVILYILLTGKTPFFASFEDDLLRKIGTGKYKWPDFLTDKKGKIVESSNGAKALVRKLMTHDERLRPTASKILEDPWLSNIKQ